MKNVIRNVKKILLSTSALLTVLIFFNAPAALADRHKTVIFVHGAFADGSVWDKVIPLLQAKGLNVVSVQNPLTSLADDVVVVKRTIAAQRGDVILVGHSWGGLAITEAGIDEKVSALVYVAAFAPDVGETISDLIKNFPVVPGPATAEADAGGFLTLPLKTMAESFAQDVSRAEVNVLTAVQGPINSRAFGDQVAFAAWKSKPSYYIVASEDRMIAPEAEAAMARKMGAATTILKASHVPMVSKPAEVAKVILTAAER